LVAETISTIDETHTRTTPNLAQRFTAWLRT
jgi:hypothetical protein